MAKMDKPWPSFNDNAFKEGGFGPTDVEVKWIIDAQWDWTLVKGFKEAADKIIDDLATDDSGMLKGKFFFPVAYLYRHSIELHLKGLISDGIKLGILDKEKTKEWLGQHDIQHNIYELWKKARYVLENVFPDLSEKEYHTLPTVEKILLQFHSIDKSGQSFRYLKNKKDEPLIQELPKSVNLQRLKNTMEALFNFFDSCDDYLEFAIECRDDNL